MLKIAKQLIVSYSEINETDGKGNGRTVEYSKQEDNCGKWRDDLPWRDKLLFSRFSWLQSHLLLFSDHVRIPVSRSFILTLVINNRKEASEI